jgi:hypothetical protein
MKPDAPIMEIICKIRCSIAHTYEAAREALSHALRFYTLADITAISWVVTRVNVL